MSSITCSTKYSNFILAYKSCFYVINVPSLPVLWTHHVSFFNLKSFWCAVLANTFIITRYNKRFLEMLMSITSVYVFIDKNNSSIIYISLKYPPWVSKHSRHLRIQFSRIRCKIPSMGSICSPAINIRWRRTHFCLGFSWHGARSRTLETFDF